MEQKIRNWSESTFYYPETHWFRLAYHIVLRGAQAGTLVGAVLGFPYALLRKRPVVETMGKWSFRGGLIGLAIMGGATIHKFSTTDDAGIEDRSFRLAHNWDQTKWDYFSLGGAAFSALFLRRAFGGLGKASAMGMAFGTVGYIVQTQFSTTEKPSLTKIKDAL